MHYQINTQPFSYPCHLFPTTEGSTVTVYLGCSLISSLGSYTDVRYNNLPIHVRWLCKVVACSANGSSPNSHQSVNRGGSMGPPKCHALKTGTFSPAVNINASVNQGKLCVVVKALPQLAPPVQVNTTST